MKTQTVDTRGALCPMPLIMTKKAVDTSSVGDIVEVLIDNETARCNVQSWLKESGIEAEVLTNNELTRLRVVISATHSSATPIGCTTPSSSAYVVAVKSDKMGEGEASLGAALMRAFINSLIETPQLPTHIILYNSGVKLAVAGSDTLDSLQQLEKRGVTIVACGTCVDFYHIKEQLLVGTIGNMYKITELLASTGHILYP